jgi:endonuclease YncB( thermonuclease family)
LFEVNDSCNIFQYKNRFKAALCFLLMAKVKKSAGKSEGKKAKKNSVKKRFKKKENGFKRLADFAKSGASRTKIIINSGIARRINGNGGKNSKDAKGRRNVDGVNNGKNGNGGDDGNAGKNGDGGDDGNAGKNGNSAKNGRNANSRRDVKNVNNRKSRSKKISKRKRQLQIFLGFLIIIVLIESLGFAGYFLVKSGAFDRLKDIGSIGDEDLAKIEIVTVKRAISGDILDTNIGIVKLIGVDAPNEGEFYFQTSKNALDILTKGNEVSLERDVIGEDETGKKLRYAYLEDIALNEFMIERGYAKASFLLDENVKHKESYEDLEIKARVLRYGLWTNQ